MRREGASISVEQALPRQVGVRLPVHHIARTIFKLLVELGVEGSRTGLGLQLSPEGECIFNESDSVEWLGVWNAKAFHPVRMTPLLQPDTTRYN